MSYSFQVPDGPTADFADRALASVSAPDDQRAAAEQAAGLAGAVAEAALKDGGALGGWSGWIGASISGHVHTGPGSSSPTLNISLRCLEAPKVDEAPAAEQAEGGDANAG